MIVIACRTTDDRPLDVAKRRWDEYTRQAHAEMGEQWQREMLPKHFAADARQRYHYQSRSEKYQKQKEKLARLGKALYGGTRDDVVTGQMMNLLRGTGVIRAYPSRVTITMVGPRYITMTPKDPKKPNKAAEILRVTDDESRELELTFARAMERQLTANSTQETYRPD